MKIKGSKSQILYGIRMVQNTVSPRASLPVLLNILLEAGGKSVGVNKLRLTTTNLEITSECTIPVEVEDEGGITIPARLFSEIIGGLPEKEVYIQTKENNINIKCEKSSFKIFGLPPNEFPSPPEIKEGTPLTINDNILKEMIYKTRFCVSTDETRHALTGVCLISKGKEIKMVATDGHRLAYIKEEIPQPAKEEISAIVPVKVLNEIVRVFPEEGEKINILVSKNYISFTLGDASLTSRLVEGVFPNYEQVIPKEPEKYIQVNTRDLLSTIGRVSLLSDERSNLIRAKAQGDTLTVTGSAPSSGEGTEELNAKSKGGDIEVGFNARYLQDVLKAIDAEETLIKLSTPSSPVLIRPFSKGAKEEGNYLCVVMPLRL